MDEPRPGEVVGRDVVRRFHPQHHGINTKDGIARSISVEFGAGAEYPNRWLREGEILEYIGQGRASEGDQTWNKYNLGMRRAMEEGRRVMVFEKIPGSPVRHRYHGNWFITGISQARAPRTGQLVFRFQVSRDPDVGQPVYVGAMTETEGIPSDISEPAARIGAVVSRVIRDTVMARRLKENYDYTCQLCAEQQRLSPGRLYAEAHHLRPLGRPHDGPDSPDNLIVLCAKHHVDFDYGAVAIDPRDGVTIRHRYDGALEGRTLKLRAKHRLAAAHIQYHWDEIYLRSASKPSP